MRRFMLLNFIILDGISIEMRNERFNVCTRVQVTWSEHFSQATRRVREV